MHTIPSESHGHTNESENCQEALSREHVESLKFWRKVESWKALLTKVLDDLLCFYSGTRRIKYFIIHKFRRLRFSKWMVSKFRASLFRWERGQASFELRTRSELPLFQNNLRSELTPPQRTNGPKYTREIVQSKKLHVELTLRDLKCRNFFFFFSEER